MNTKIKSVIKSTKKFLSKTELCSKKRYKHFKFTNIYWNEPDNYIKYNRISDCFEWKDKEPVNMGMLNFEGYFAINRHHQPVRL